MVRCITVVLGLAVALAGCEQRHAAVTGVAPAGQAQFVDPAPAPAPTAAPDVEDGLAGTVLETMDAAGYTYAKLDTGHAQVWVAGPETKLAVGMKIGRMDGQLMNQFRSETLKRTFAEIYFVGAFAVSGGAVGGAAPMAAAAPADGPSGTVVETMSSGGYTYALLDHAGTKVWIAGPETKLAVGTKLGVMSGSLMSGFRSDTLKRTFDQIYFVSAFAQGDAGDAAVANPHGANPHGAAPAVADVAVDKIAPAPGGTAIADVFARKAALVGKPLVVRGKVVKVNDGILGRNWLHLRDGSGGPGTNDLLVTSATSAKLGDVITARGTVAANKDFGAGYHYDLVVEDATLTP